MGTRNLTGIPCVKNGNLLNHFFTQTVWKKLMNDGSHCLLDAILRRYASTRFNYKKATNRDVIKWLYQFLSKSWRNEYFFRNELMWHYLVEERPSDDVVALTQLQVGGSRADFVIVNGEGIVYEIKTDYDSLYRLDSQLADYYKAFSRVYVVVGEALLKETKRHLMGSSAGILCLTRDNQLRQVKKARRDSTKLDSRAMFKTLRRSEFDAVLQEFYGELPMVSRVEYFRAAYAMFSQIPMRHLCRAFERQLKKRMCNAHVSKTRELLALTYFWNDACVSERAIASFAQRRYRHIEKTNPKRRVHDVSTILSLF